MSEIQTNTAELIPIREHEGQQAVSGRELHEFLQIGRDYSTWFKQMLEYGFTEGHDYLTASGEVYPRTGENLGGRPRIDHLLTLDMGKELGMIQRNELGRRIRRYFIEVEKRARQVPPLPASYADALRELASSVEQNAALEAKVAEDAPKVLFADSVATSDTTILVGDLAKILKGNGVEVGGTRLFEWLRRDGFLIKRRGADWNSPTQRAMELGLFRLKETAVTHSDGHVTVNKTPKVTGKGQAYLVNYYTEKVAA